MATDGAGGADASAIMGAVVDKGGKMKISGFRSYTLSNYLLEGRVRRGIL
jgi:hypothetical protein